MTNEYLWNEIVDGRRWTKVPAGLAARIATNTLKCGLDFGSCSKKEIKDEIKSSLLDEDQRRHFPMKEANVLKFVDKMDKVEVLFRETWRTANEIVLRK